MKARPFYRSDDGIVDDVAVERRCAGEPVPLSSREIDAAIARMAAARHTLTTISKTLRLSGARVSRTIAEQQIDVIAAGSTVSEDVAAVPTGRTPAA